MSVRFRSAALILMQVRMINKIMKTCENCNIEHSGDYGSGRFCSSPCSRAFSTKDKREDINNKVSNKMSGRSTWNKGKTGIYTAVTIEKMSNSHKGVYKKPKNGKRKGATPSTETKEKISKSTKGKTGGYRTNSGTSKKNGTRYKGIWLDSSWELLLAKRLDALSITWQRGNAIQYIDINDQNRKYYPDFFLPDRGLYLEVKGYYTEASRHKLKEAAKVINLQVLDSIKSINEFS